MYLSLAHHTITLYVIEMIKYLFVELLRRSTCKTFMDTSNDEDPTHETCPLMSISLSGRINFCRKSDITKR